MGQLSLSEDISEARSRIGNGDDGPKDRVDQRAKPNVSCLLVNKPGNDGCEDQNADGWEENYVAQGHIALPQNAGRFECAILDGDDQNQAKNVEERIDGDGSPIR